MSTAIEHITMQLAQLQPERLEEVVDFIATREQERRMVRAAQVVSEAALATLGPTRLTPHMAAYDFGDVLLVPFPSTDQTGVKQRPAVVVNSARLPARTARSYLDALTGQNQSSTRFGDVPSPTLAPPVS